MTDLRGQWSDERLDRLLGNLLRTGVLLSAAIVAAGGVYYLFQYGQQSMPDFRVFDPAAPCTDHHDLDCVAEPLRSLSGIFSSAWALHSRGIIQLGIIVLIATPIARVIFSVFAFAVQRDYTYVAVTLIVLAVLLYGLLSGHTP